MYSNVTSSLDPRIPSLLSVVSLTANRQTMSKNMLDISLLQLSYQMLPIYDILRSALLFKPARSMQRNPRQSPRRGFLIPGTRFRILCQLNLQPGFKSLVGFWILRAAFRIPEPGIPDFISKHFPDSGICIPLHGVKKRQQQQQKQQLPLIQKKKYCSNC